ncbi:hypothetical protein [Acidiferrobacter sp.]|uniref:hypothetical protein n=1 Tax=Acidiferrobacter sp. TaxID=1872107 RepID=UPI0026166957|nr:hypothetical protein [Acidiferrobacter sp.]
MSGHAHDELTADEVIAMLAMLKGVDPPILVGGQALNVLARHYRVEGFDAQFSIDMDFVGDSEEARQVARLWGAEVKVPTMDDNTPNTAIVTIRRPGRAPLIVNFLESVAESAFGAEVPSIRITENDVEMRVMHPLSCLQSRLWNMYGPLARRNGREIDRAHLAIRVLHAHLTALLNNDDARGALKVIERLARRVALSRVSRKAWAYDRIDVLTAVPASHNSLPEMFRTVRWPSIQKEVHEARQTDEQVQESNAARASPEGTEAVNGRP